MNENKAVVFRDYETYFIIGSNVNLVSDELDYGRNTIAEIDGTIYYLGSEPVNITSAIFAWQELNGRILTAEELSQVMIDNYLTSQAI